MTRTNLQILQEEFAAHIPINIIVEVTDVWHGQAIISRLAPVDGTNTPQPVMLFRGHYTELPKEIERILADPILAFIQAGWNPDGVKVVDVEDKPDLNKFAGKKKLKDIGIGDL